MNLKSFLGNLAKTCVVLGSLSASAFLGGENVNNGPSWGCAPACPPACTAPPQCGWGYNPPAYTKCGSGSANFVDSLGFRADFLYWRPSADQLALGSENTIVPSSSSSVAVVDKSYVKRPSFDFEAGFRLGLNHFCPCDCWDVALNWTHYHNKASVSGDTDVDYTLYLSAAVLPSSPYTVFVPYWERAANLIPDSAEGHWTFDVDMIDLEFGHKYFVFSCFVMRPHLGLRAARINQGFHVESYADRSDIDDDSYFGFGDSNVFTSVVKAGNDFLAIGPRLGLGLELDLGCGFSIVGEAAGSVLFGRAKRHAHEEFNGEAVSDNSVPFEYEGNGTHGGSSRFVTDLALGIKWDHCMNWCNQSYPLTVALLWEHHNFVGFNEFSFGSNGYELDVDPNVLPVGLIGGAAKPSGNVFTQGLTVVFNVGF